MDLKNSSNYRNLAAEIGTLFDLDREDIVLLKTDRSKYGITDYPKCHVHDVLILEIDNQLFYAKGEDVYLRVSSQHSLNYRNFLDFSISLFEIDECSVPRRTFSFLDDPYVSAVQFDRKLVQQQASVIEKLADETPPGEIQNPRLRELFIFYLSRKEKLVSKNGVIYDDVFNHHGRDVIHEVLGSAIGRLLGVPVPTNHFATGRSRFKSLYSDAGHPSVPDHQRYVLSAAISSRHPCPFLMDVLNRQFKELEITRGLSLYREESNPLSLERFPHRDAADTTELGNLIIHNCDRYTDLVRSDFLDRLLGGTKDRKPYDYLLPNGLAGPIYTVDFGEILFPELMFDPGESHYLQKKAQKLAELQEYIDAVHGLPRESIYRMTVADLAAKIRALNKGVITHLVKAIPECFLLDHMNDEQYCYLATTLIDYLDHSFELIAESRDQ